MNGFFRVGTAATFWYCALAMGGFILLESAPCALLHADEWGNLTGRVLVDGALEPTPKINPDKDGDYCLAGGHEIFNETVVVGADHGLRDVYVMLYLARGDQPPPVHPSFEALKKKPVTLDNKMCRFEPHAAFVRTGQILTMRNGDQIGHNIHTLNNDEKNKNVPVGGSVDGPSSRMAPQTRGPLLL